MRIGVCFKIVPDYEGLMPEEWYDPENLDFTYVKKMYGCFDEAALEMALQIADECKASGAAVKTVAVTCGAPCGAVSEGLLRALFAAGFDDVALLPAADDFAPADTAHLLASYFRENHADLILTGRMVGPGDSGMTPFYLAKELDLPLFTELTTASYDASSGRIEMTCKDGAFLKVYRLMGKAIGTVGDAESPYLRLFPLKARMEAMKRHFTLWESAEETEKNDAILLCCPAEPAGDGPRYIPPKPTEDAAKELMRFLKKDDTSLPAEKNHESCSAATQQDKELAMRFAAEKGLSCHTDVFSFHEENGRQYAVRHVYSTHLEGCFPAAGSVCTPSPAASESLPELAASIRQIQMSDSGDLLRSSVLNATLLREIPLEQKEDIAAARLVLLGGKGLEKKENFKRLEALASKVGAVCGCTRPVAMAGWASYDNVVGLSGAMLQADVCIAFGVSGAAPLMQGAGSAKRLIAINNDPKAPIFSRCSDGLVADCLEIMEAMEALASAAESAEAPVSEEEQ